jgi:hypothetical protein
MSFFVIDVEADGPCPGLYSMVSFAAVKLTNELDQTFCAKTHPITADFDPDALAISCPSREEHMTYGSPITAMNDFKDWLLSVNVGTRPVFLTDNLAFDWQWINYYFHKFVGENPFGYSGRRIGDLWCGLQKNAYSSWKHLRDTPHDHDPLNDAMGNAEALIKMKRRFGLSGIKITS